MGLGVLGLIGAAGMCMLKRWGLWLTIVVSVLNILAAAPGLVFAPDPTSRALATIGIVGFALVILLAALARAAPGVHLTDFREHAFDVG